MNQNRNGLRLRLAAYGMGLLLAFAGGTVFGASTRSLQAQSAAVTQPVEFSIFWEAWQLVVDHFVDRDKVDFRAMTYGAIRGLLETLDDQNHTMFFDPQQAIQEEQSLEGAFEGIGAYVNQENEQFIITQPMHGSPAEAAGLLPGDVILAVDGESIEGLSQSEVIAKIRGPAGTSVVLTVKRSSIAKPFDLTIQRAKVEIENVLWARIPNSDLAYLQITQFSDQTAIEVRQALQTITSAMPPIKGLVLDLRNNPGGYLNEAIQVGSQFLAADKVILRQRDANGQTTTFTSAGGGLAQNLPMIVLMNEGTASAGEILAGALKENGRSKLVGETTSGTGTILNSFTLSDGSLLRLGVTNWLTPNYQLVKKKGIQPSVTIAQEASVRLIDGYILSEETSTQIEQYADRQFNTALLLLRLHLLN